jgi:glycosyltransferase involved in cell wall biosynthesis
MNKKIFYIPHGVESKIKKTKINLDLFKTSPENLKVIYVGDQFTKFKKVDKIVLAAKGLKCDVFLFGTTNKELIPLGGKNVHFMGQIHPYEIPSVLKQADILVNTADMDHNFKLFEYIRAGKPILAIDGKARYIFTHGENAFLTNDIGKGLNILINNKRLREKIEENVKKIQIKTWNEVSRAHLEICENLVYPS